MSAERYKEMKKNLKKLIAVLIMVLAMTALAACSSDEPAQPENVTEAVTKAPETTPTEEVTATPDPTSTPTPVPTEEPTAEPTEAEKATDSGLSGTDITGTEETDPVITGTEDPDIIEIDPIDDVNSPLETKYSEFSSDVDASAKAVAEKFMNAFVTYNAEDMVATIAYDEEHKSELDEIESTFNEIKTEMAAALGGETDISKFITIELIGGTAVSSENVDMIYGALVNTDEVTDLQVFTAAMSTTIPYLQEAGSDTYQNVIVGKYKGEYKVIATDEVYENDDDDIIDIDPSIDDTENTTLSREEIEALMYQFNGSESADEIADLFIAAYSKLDMIKMYSCIGMDEATKEEAIAELGSIMQEMELITAFLTEDSIKITRGEAEEVTAEELDTIALNAKQVSMDDVSDMVKYSLHIDMNVMGQAQSQDTYLYIGKYKGEYRIIYTEAFGL